MNMDRGLFNRPSSTVLADIQQLDALFATYQTSLNRFPVLFAELKAASATDQQLDVPHFLQHYEPALQLANAFMLAVDHLEPNVVNHSMMRQFLLEAEGRLSRITVAGLYHELRVITAEVNRLLTIPQSTSVAERPEVSIRIPELVTLLAGSFIMGCVSGRDDVGTAGMRCELPAHAVTLQAFQLGKYPVTFAEFDCFCAVTGYRLPFDYGWGRENRPVIDVSWQDAQAYVEWLNWETEGGWYLPSEAEWEYAARANGNSAYAWGAEFDPLFANADNVHAQTTAVDRYPPNAFGLHDMHGNVWEWCRDAWHENYEGAPTDGRAWLSLAPECVWRGGSWFTHAYLSRSAYRYRFKSTHRDYYLGFRVARTLNDQ